MNIILIVIILFIILIIAWAIFGGKDEGLKEAEAENREPEKTLRRRTSDKEIEDESTDEPSDDEVSDHENESASKSFDTSNIINLPYLADDIIPESSRLRIYRRTLINSEIYAKKDDFSTSISLYQGVHSRINDLEVKSKIEENIDYLKYFKKKKEEYTEKKKDDAFKRIDQDMQTAAMGSDPNTVQVKFDGAVPNTINIAVPDQPKAIDPDEIAEKVLKQIRGKGEDIDYGEIKKSLQDKNKREISELLNDLDGVRVKNNEIKNDVNEFGNEVEKLSESQNGDENTEILKVMNQIDGLKHKTKVLDSDIEVYSDDINTIKNSGLNDQTKELPGLNTSMDYLKNKTIGIDNEKETSRNELEKLKLSNDRSIIEKIQGDLKSLADSDDVEGSISDLKGRLDNITSLQADIEKIENLKNDIEKIENLKNDMGKTSGFQDEIDNLKKKFDDLSKGTAPVSEQSPTRESLPVSEQKSETAPPSVPAEKSRDTDDLKGRDSDESPVKTREEEKVIEKEKEEEAEEDGFDLLKDYGKDKDSDELSDEEIFEKILKDDAGHKESEFEIRGEKKEDFDEYSMSDEKLSQKKKEDERFYRNILNTDTRKKRELPILKVSYDFSRLPEDDGLSREKNILEYSFYKYKNMLEKADFLIKKRRVRDAINYYKVVMSQNVPPEFKVMIKRNIDDLTEYLKKYLTGE